MPLSLLNTLSYKLSVYLIKYIIILINSVLFNFVNTVCLYILLSKSSVIRNTLIISIKHIIILFVLINVLSILIV